MNFNREYMAIIVGYLIVVLYIAFVNNFIINIILVLILFAIHMQLYNQIKKRMSFDKNTSMNRLQTRLEKTRKKQEEMSERFFSLSQSFGSGLLMVDEDGFIQYVNTDMERYFGTIDLEQEYQKLIETKDLYKFVNEAYLLEKTIRKQIVFEGRNFDLISTPIFEDKMFKGALILAHDITLLRQAEEYQKRFTADVSHELRTPLSAIKGFSEILSRDNISNEDKKEFISLLQKESERMEVLLRDLTEISKLDRLDYELERQRVDIKALVDETLGILSQRIQESNLDINCSVESTTLHIDKNRIVQVLINIIRNAINYTDKGSISITGIKDKNTYIIKIKDTGIGIKEEDYDRIFKRFYRVDKARSRDSGGSGLGLSISKNAVLKHGGTIQVTSKVKHGSTFTITLPIDE